VVSANEVEFEGQTYKLSPLVKEWRRRTHTATPSEAYQGAANLLYKGTLLKDLPDI
jgi:hypothetical protein